MVEETPENFRARMNSKRPNDRKNGLPNLAVQIAEAGKILPTPQARDYRSGNNPEVNAHKRKMEQGWSLELPTLIGMLPTPRAAQGRGAGQTPRDTVESVVELGGKKGSSGAKTGFRLQPGFALWMMGYPTDWLDLEDGEMPLSKARATPLFPK